MSLYADMTRPCGLVLTALLVMVGGPDAAAGQAPAPPRVTIDIPFKSHDGYEMRGRLTLPDTPGRHPVLVMVQTAEAMTVDQRIRNAAGVVVPVFDVYRDPLTPLGIGFFSYDGRGVTTSATGGRVIDRTVYDTSTLENKVLDLISAVRLLQKQPGVDAGQLYLHGSSEGTLLAASAATRIPNEVAGVVLYGIVAETLKQALRFMVDEGMFMQHLGHWDADGDRRITAAEFEADPRGIRKRLPPEVTFSNFDLNGDGVHTADERTQLSAPIVEGIDKEDLDVVGKWLSVAASVPVPRTFPEWAREHFEHPPLEAVLLKLHMPIAMLQGDVDTSTPASDVRALQKRIEAAGKSNISFEYFPTLGHDLGALMYFTTGELSPGYAAIVEFMRRQTTR